jgi:RimJ/RimL family protein N-acetyltransferase
MTIREATLIDVPALVAMGQRFRAESSYASLVAENPAQMAETATKLIEGQGVVFVAEDRGGAIVGMIGFYLFVHPMSGQLTAGETFWWSDVPAVGMGLFRRGKAWALAQGAETLLMTQPAAVPRLGLLYKKLGFTPVETAWQLDLSAQEAVA